MVRYNFSELSEKELCMISGGLDNHDVGVAETIIGAIGLGSVGIVIGVA